MSEPLPRRRNNDNNSPHGYEDRMSPPRRQRLNDDDRSSSPPRRQRERSESPPIPLRRRIVNDEDRSPSPPRPPRRQILNDNDRSPSPPRRRIVNDDDRSPSPPRRQRERSESPPIPLRRRIVNDEDRSPSPPRPPRRQRERSESPPILRQRHTMNDRSPSPPRGREMMGPANTTTTTRETSLSPIRRRRTAASHSRSPSPPRHHSSRRDEPISPPRNRAMNDHTPSSPRRQPPQSSRHIIHGGTIRPRQYSTSPPPGAMRKRGNDGEPFFPTDTGMTAQANPQQPAPMSLPPQSAPPQKTTTVLRDKHGNALSTQQLEQLELFMAEQAEEEKQKSQQQDSARSKTQKLTIDTLHKIKEYKERMINKASTTGQDQTLYGAGLAQYKQHIKDTVLKVMGKDRFRDPARRLRADLSKDQHAQILTEDPLWLEQRKQEELEIIAAEQKAQRKEYERAHKLQRAHAAALEAGDEKEAEIIQNKIAQRAQEEYEDAMNAIRVEAVAVDFRVVRHPITGEVLKRVKKPTYEGAASWPNRFGIKPGYRWDGVDRSNHWEDVRKDVLRKGKQ